MLLLCFVHSSPRAFNTMFRNVAGGFYSVVLCTVDVLSNNLFRVASLADVFMIPSTVYSLLAESCLSSRCCWGVDGDLFDTREGVTALETCVTGSIETAFGMPFLSIVTVFSCTLMMWIGLVGCSWNLLYFLFETDSVACPRSHAAAGYWEEYMYLTWIEAPCERIGCSRVRFLPAICAFCGQLSFVVLMCRLVSFYVSVVGIWQCYRLSWPLSRRVLARPQRNYSSALAV